MAFYFDSWLTELLIALCLPIVALYLWFNSSFKYWKSKGAPYIEPSFPFGNMSKTILGQQHLTLLLADFYKQLKGHRFGGFYAFRRPMLLIRDPDLIRYVLVKDFSSFHDRGIPVDEEVPMTKHLLALSGTKWKKTRSKLSPTFTSGKMKMMFQTMRTCGEEMVDVLCEVADRGEVSEMRELSARFTTDVISSVVFGIEVHCQRDPDNQFRRWGRTIFEPSWYKSFLGFVRNNFPQAKKLLRFDTSGKDFFSFFRDLIDETVLYREKNNITRNDFMHLLMQLKNKGYVELDNKTESEQHDKEWKLTLDDLTVHAVTFFLAGFETSSTTMSFALHELAYNPDVQKKLQQEIDVTLKQNGGEFSYEAIMGMKYLDKVVSETLRKHSPAGSVNREVTEDYVLPDSNVLVEKGTMVFVPTYALHHDPEYFPDPERFDPERFSEENKAGRHPYVYLPFGEGPRNCIGMRFGILQAKVGLAYLLSKLNVETSEKSRRVVSYHPSSAVLMSNTGIQLRLTRRN